MCLVVITWRRSLLGAQLSMCRKTLERSILLFAHCLISFENQKILWFFFLMYSQVSAKLTLKRDNGLYNLYVMYLKKDAITITVLYSIKEQNWVLFQKRFNWKFQLSDNEKNNSCSCACSSVQRNRFWLHVFIHIACKCLSKWQKKTLNNQHYWLVSSIALQVIILY